MTLKQALWEIVRDESIIITNQNIDWLLDRASKKATGDAQALKESILERKGVIEENFPSALTNEQKVSEKVKQIEKMAKVIYDNRPIPEIWQEDAEEIANILYNAGYRKQSEGEWIIDRSPIEAEFKCSKCGYSYIEADPQARTEYKFCPECGAKMKGGEA